MCQFLSAIVTRNKKILCDPLVDSHEELIKIHGLRDGAAPGASQFVRVEFTPQNDKHYDPADYKLSLDEHESPSWWDDAMAFDVAEDLRDRIAGMVVTGKKYGLFGGCYILHDAEVENIHHCRIVSVSGKSKLSNLWIATDVRDVRDSASIRDVRDSASIRDVWDSASIRGVRDSASISGVWGSASIRGVRGSASIRGVWGSASIRGVGDSASIRDVRDSASIRGVWGSASIRDVRDSASIRDVRDSASISDVGPNVTITGDHRDTANQ